MIDFIITARELQAKGFCASGQWRWFEAHGLDFKAFLKDGIAASALLATGDALGIRAVELVGAGREQE